MALTIAAAVALALTAPGPSTGADPPIACPLIGCASGVYIEVDRPPAGARSARVCVDGRCGRQQQLLRSSGGGGSILVRLPKDKRRAGASVGVRIVFLDRERRVLTRSRTRGKVGRTQPNGPGCPPTCFQLGLRYHRDTGLTGA